LANDEASRRIARCSLAQAHHERATLKCVVRKAFRLEVGE